MFETRNIVDHYHYWATDAILADLNTKRKNFSVLCSNLGNDFNIATVIRNANAFLAEDVIVYGRKGYDRRGTVGTHHYTNFRHIHVDDLVSLHSILIGKTLVAVDNVEGAEPIDEMEWDPNVHYVFAFGQEQIGLPDEILAMASKVVYIRQYGSVRSLNVGTAAGIAMYAYCTGLSKKA